MALLDYCQYRVLNAQADSLERLEALMRSALPEKWSVVFRIKRLREKAAAQAYITTEETIETLASIMRACRVMGPNSHEVIQERLEPLILALGLSEAVSRTAEAAPVLTQSGRSGR